MCVICYVPKNTYLPKKDTIRAMWDKNHDGAGVMYKTENNEVFYKKGYFDFEMFYADLVEISKRAKEMAIHCRIATSGGVNKEMCHPYPLTNEIGRLKSPFGNKCDKPIIMHNGIININNIGDLNDTCSYIIKKLVPRYKRTTAFMFDETIVDHIQDEIGYSKLLIMSQYPTKMIGNWQKDDDGCYYSNLYFKPYMHDYRTISGYNVYGAKTKYDLFDSYSLVGYND